MILSKETIIKIIDDITLDFMKPNRFVLFESGNGYLLQFQSFMTDRDTGETT